MLYYSVAFYYERCKNELDCCNNIKKHIEVFLNIEEEDKEFILVCFIDTPRGHINYKNAKNHIEEFCLQQLPNKNYHIMVEYNWGGTIAALWYAYLYIKSRNISDTTYIAHFEEDFHSINDKWFVDSKNLLNSTDSVYIGEHTASTSNPEQNEKMCKVVKNDTRCHGEYIFKDIYSKYNCNIIDSKYTDGGYYFSNLINLKCIEKKIGIFHKGNQHTKYDHTIDGIILGEVGFPSQIAQFYNFIGLDRKKYFSHTTTTKKPIPLSLTQETLDILFSKSNRDRTTLLQPGLWRLRLTQQTKDTHETY